MWHFDIDILLEFKNGGFTDCVDLLLHSSSIYYSPLSYTWWMIRNLETIAALVNNHPECILLVYHKQRKHIKKPFSTSINIFYVVVQSVHKVCGSCVYHYTNATKFPTLYPTLIPTLFLRCYFYYSWAISGSEWLHDRFQNQYGYSISSMSFMGLLSVPGLVWILV